MQTFERFLTAVRLGTDAERPAAEACARATLTTFFERLSGGQAADMAEQLRPPDGFVPARATLRNRPAEPFSLAEFLRRVAHRERSDEESARTHATVVLHALQLVVAPKEVRDAVDQLPAEFAVLLTPRWRPQHPAPSGRDLVQLVAERSGLPAEAAGRDTEGVLEALAERLPDKDLDELTQRLPDDLRPALGRGRARRTAPRKLSAEAFIELVGERVRAAPPEARAHATAVLPALAEVIDDAMLAELLTDLPDDYADLLVTQHSPAGSG